jgi:hypothetical protein
MQEGRQAMEERKTCNAGRKKDNAERKVGMWR